MSHTINRSHRYQVGGTLKIKENVIYIQREADRKLYEALISGEYCYVLNSRQMGKSSLAIYTIERLKEQGFACAFIDLNELGSQNISQEQWYAGIARSLIKELRLDDRINLLSWWKTKKLLSPIQKLHELVRDIILVEIQKPIVIFIDEIEKILTLEFNSNDFFGLIRTFYNSKASNSNFERLGFTLIGVARPDELVQDSQITPFNIGIAINLTGFSLEEALPLASGLKNKFNQPQKAFKQIISWTEGQPFLTQKICKLIVESIEKITEPNEIIWITQFIKKNIIEGWKDNDDPVHFKTIKSRIVASKFEGKLLSLINIIHKNGSIISDDSQEQIELRLSGLVTKKNEQIIFSNYIYQNIFNRDWVTNQIFQIQRPYAGLLKSWVNSNYDKKWLLKGESLEKALKWKEEKILSHIDDRYLNDSQQENSNILLNLEIEKRKKAFWFALFLLSIIVGIGFAGSQGYKYCLEEGTVKKGCFSFDTTSGEEIKGKKNIFRSQRNFDLEEGIRYFSDGKYESAMGHFQTAVEEISNDPIPEIFLNNAYARNNEKGSYKLAVIVPLNTEEDYARTILRGVADAQTKLRNDGGIEGSLLEIVIANDRSQPNIAKGVATKLKNKSEILGVIGHSSSDASQQALKVYEKDRDRMAMISPSSTSTELESPVFFRTIPSDKLAGEKLAQYAVQNVSAKKSLIFYDEENGYSNSIKSAFESQFRNSFGGEIVKIINLKDWKEDKVKSEDKLKDLLNKYSNLDIIALFPSVDTSSVATNIIKANARLSSQKKIKILGNDLMYGSTILQNGASAAEGLILATSLSRETCYGKKASKRWKGHINWRTAASYDATQAFIKAIKKTVEQSHQVNRQNVLKNLQTIKLNQNETSGEELYFEDSGNSNRKSRLVKIVNSKSKLYQPLEIPTPLGTKFGFKEIDRDRDSSNQDCS